MRTKKQKLQSAYEVNKRGMQGYTKVDTELRKWTQSKGVSTLQNQF